jgi:hypothetical protein
LDLLFHLLHRLCYAVSNSGAGSAQTQLDKKYCHWFNSIYPLSNNFFDI